MKSTVVPALVVALAIWGLSACGNTAEEQEPVPTATVEVQPAAQRRLEQVLIAYGTVEFLPARTRSLTVQVESQVAERFVLPGSAVKEGQPLLRLVPSAASRLDVDKAARDASVAVAESQRVDRLHAQGLATDSDLRTAQAAADTAVALRNSLVARIGAASGKAQESQATAAAGRGVTLHAPISGIVDAFTARPGDVIPAGTLLLRVADPTAVYVHVGVEPADAASVHAGQAVTLSELFPQAVPRSASIGEIDSRVDSVTKLASAVVHPAQGSGLIPGSAVRARIVVETHEHAITVPRSAVLYTAERPFVFVAAAGKALRRPVSTGIAEDDRIEILTGLKAGEPVITGGNYELEDGMAIRQAAARGTPAPPASNAPSATPRTQSASGAS